MVLWNFFLCTLESGNSVRDLKPSSKLRMPLTAGRAGSPHIYMQLGEKLRTSVPSRYCLVLTPKASQLPGLIGFTSSMWLKTIHFSQSALVTL